VLRRRLAQTGASQGGVRAAHADRHRHAAGEEIDVNVPATRARLLSLAAAFSWAFPLAADAFLMGGPDCSIAVGSLAWCWNGSLLSPFRSALTDPAKFGPGGTVNQSISTVNLTAANFAATLPTLDGFIAPWWTTTEATPYTASIRNYFLNGGNLLVLADNSGNDPVNAALGIPTRFTGSFPASSTRTTTGAAPLYDGPFGTASSVLQAGSFGELRPADVILSGGQIVGLDATGRVVAAVWDQDAFAPGSGRLVIATDVDMLTQGDYTAMNDNARFSLNAASWLAQGGPVVGETTPYYVLAGADCSLATQSDGWCWGGVVQSRLRAALEEPLNFGPVGTVERRILPIDIPDFSAATLARVDGIVVPWWEDSEANLYADAIRNALLAGKDVFLMQDDPGHDRVGEAFGIATGFSSCSGPQPMSTTGSGPLYDGPFGTASVVNQFGSYGALDPAVVAALGGTIDGRSECNEVTGAYWLDNALRPGSGRLIVVTDVDMLDGGVFIGPPDFYSTPRDDNARFALNAFALLTAPAPAAGVAEPDGLVLLGVALGALASATRRSRRARDLTLA